MPVAGSVQEELQSEKALAEAQEWRHLQLELAQAQECLHLEVVLATGCRWGNDRKC